MSLSLLLAIEQQTRPMLDHASLKAELINNPNMKQFTRESPGHHGEGPTPTLTIVSPVAVMLDIDGVTLKMEAEIVIDGYFHKAYIWEETN